VLAALGKAGFDFDFLEEDFVEQANVKRWPSTSPALDCTQSPTQDNDLADRQAA
jgi:hypothetical protein